MATSKAVVLKADTYYVSMKSTNAAKGGSVDYQATLDAASVFFTNQDNSDDVWDSLAVKNIDLDSPWNGWVGYEDAIDFCTFQLQEATSMDFNITATDKTKFTLYKVDAKSGKLRQVISKSLSLDKTSMEYAAEAGARLLDAGIYYMAMQSTNAAKGGNADYSVTAITNDAVFFNNNLRSSLA